MTVILYTGKGGVGKTSMAAAVAAAGKRMVVDSTDAAHSLADSFDREPRPVGRQPLRVSDTILRTLSFSVGGQGIRLNQDSRLLYLGCRL